MKMEDIEYLSVKLSKASFQGLGGYKEATLVSVQCELAFHGVNAALALSVLLRLGVRVVAGSIPGCSEHKAMRARRTPQ